jgi:hypothetical protein
LLALLLTTTALAKGNFAFVSISGGNLKGEIRTADRNLTTDWFAFADLSASGLPAPADPPKGGYVIIRYYIDGHRDVVFDHLHYYPAAGLVYYDGIGYGSSNWDGKWLIAKPGIERTFRNALTVELARHAGVIRRS